MTGAGVQQAHTCRKRVVLRPERVRAQERRRYQRLVLLPTPGSAGFYRRAGFRPAGDRMLILDAAQLAGLDG